MMKPARTRRPTCTTTAVEAEGTATFKEEKAGAGALRLSEGVKREPARIHLQIRIEEDLLAWLRAKNKH